jgi:uncharacterized protein YcbX
LSTTGKIAQLCRYPVKGLSADPLERVTLEAGRQIPHDRRFAIARPATKIDPDAAVWMKRKHFYNLSRDHSLGQLATQYDAETTCLNLHHDGRQVSQATLSDPMGRKELGQALAAFLGEQEADPPKVVDAGEQVLSDKETPVISIINLASLEDLERFVGEPVDPRRFRANVYLAGLSPWVERDWPGKRLRIGDVTLKVLEQTIRCMATHVNPDTGADDMDVQNALRRCVGDTYCGVYATVETGGKIAVGDTVTVPDA